MRHRLFQERVGVVVALADRVVGVRAQHRLGLHRLEGLAYTARGQDTLTGKH